MGLKFGTNFAYTNTSVELNYSFEIDRSIQQKPTKSELRLLVICKIKTMQIDK